MSLPFPILFENKDILAIEKPAGLLVHKAEGKEDEETVADILVRAYPEICTVGDHPDRPGIVHRLDKLVSGCLVIAKTQEAFLHLKAQFQNRTIEKIYAALAYGRMSKDHDTITLPISRSKKTGQYVARPMNQEGREAITDYDVVARYKTATLLDVRIHTGRPHQIRVHLAAIGHPVVGDTLYGRPMRNIRTIPMERIFLHARILAFDAMNGERIRVESPLPDDLSAMLKTLPVT